MAADETTAAGSIDKHASVRSLAFQKNRLLVFQSYHPVYVEKCFTRLHEPQKVWNALKIVFATFDRIRNDEICIDQEAFKRFLVIGGTVLSGRDLDGRPLIYTRMSSGIYEVKIVSPQASAYVRACLRMFERISWSRVPNDM
jgi:radical SAM superfamily enzyme with C-terminal helix-hairpin-helix motif